MAAIEDLKKRPFYSMITQRPGKKLKGGWGS